MFVSCWGAVDESTEVYTLTGQSLRCPMQFDRTPTLRLWKARTPENSRVPQELNQISLYCPIAFAFQTHSNPSQEQSPPCSGPSLPSGSVLHISLAIWKLMVLFYKNNCVNLWKLIGLQTLPTAVFVSPDSIFELLWPLKSFHCVLGVPDSFLAQMLVEEGWTPSGRVWFSSSCIIRKRKRGVVRIV